MGFRPTAVVPLLLSALSFALALLVVLSGTTPGLIDDAYMVKINTTSFGNNLIIFSPASPASPVESSSIPVAPTAALAARQATAAPTLAIPTASSVPAASTPAPASPLANISVLGAFFQILLNSFASGSGTALQTIVTGLITAQKQDLSQFYQLHLGNVCKGTPYNATNTLSNFTITDCPTFRNLSSNLVNYTSTISGSVDVVALNITLPILNKTPELGRSGKFYIDLFSGVIFVFFIIHLIGAAVSFFASAAAIFMPNTSFIYGFAAAITTITTLLYQMAVTVASGFAKTINSSINSLSDTTGLTSDSGSKFQLFIWVSLIAAVISNIYWQNVWFVEFRKRSYKARARTPDQMGNYRAIGKEILSDIRLRKGEQFADDTERLVTIEHYLANRDSKQ